MSLNRRSRLITHGIARSPNRAMLRAVGFGDGDFEKPIVGVANGHSTMNPCNAGIQPLVDRAMVALKENGAMPQVFGVPTVTDGIGMGTEGMKYSLVSREVIADAIETSVNGQCMDGVLVVGGCDKNMPAAMMAMARINVPGIFVYAGTIKPGHWKGQALTIVSPFEAVGAYTAGTMAKEDYDGIERNACPTVGACGGMYTANTMSSSFEALGMSLMGSSQMASPDPEKADSAEASAKVLVNAIAQDIKPRDIITRESIENAISLVMATGGSTNAVLHYLAIAAAAEVPWTIEDFERIRQRVPVLCDLKPSGKYVAVDFHRAGGVPQVLKMLLNAGLLHGDCITITGRTVAQELEGVPDTPRAVRSPLTVSRRARFVLLVTRASPLTLLTSTRSASPCTSTSPLTLSTSSSFAPAMPSTCTSALTPSTSSEARRGTFTSIVVSSRGPREPNHDQSLSPLLLISMTRCESLPSIENSEPSPSVPVTSTFCWSQPVTWMRPRTLLTSTCASAVAACDALIGEPACASAATASAASSAAVSTERWRWRFMSFSLSWSFNVWKFNRSPAPDDTGGRVARGSAAAGRAGRRNSDRHGAPAAAGAAPRRARARPRPRRASRGSAPFRRGARHRATRPSRRDSSRPLRRPAPATSLNNQYTVFGEVQSGQDIVNGIPLRDPDQNPTTPGEQIVKITISES